jgi:hypothetical protein
MMKHGVVINGGYDPQESMKYENRNNYIRSVCDQNNLRFVGWSQNRLTTGCLDELFSCETVDTISRKVTELTMGVGENDRPIVVPDCTICSVMSDVYINQRPKTGDIYSRYIIPDSGLRNDVQQIIDKTIEIITSNIKNSLGMERNNSKLSIWTTVYGEGNPHGLQQTSHGSAKINHNRPMSMFFFSNY